jgi:hypothetical protein
VSHAEDLRDIAAWVAVHEPAMGNAPAALEAAAMDIVQGAVQLRATVAVLRQRAVTIASPRTAAMCDFLRARADDIETVANRLDPPQEATS